MKTINYCKLLFVGLWLSASCGFAQDNSKVYAQMNKDLTAKENTMKTYLIERDIPDVGKLTTDQLKDISTKSNEVLAEMGPHIQWLHSYVTENKVYCVYKAESKEAIKEHAEKGGFPANKISELATTIDPGTARN